MEDRLWSDIPQERLYAATVINKESRDRIVNTLIESSPMKPWPFGMPTVANPYILYIGPSPGNSPNPNDSDPNSNKPFQAPPLGYPHEKIYYNDSRNYWEKVRISGEILIRHLNPEIAPKDCHALIGQLNFGTGFSGQAINANIEEEYARWVPNVIFNHLKPKHIILVGLQTLMTNPKHFSMFNNWGKEINWNKPHYSYDFKSYQNKKFKFKIWKTNYIGKWYYIVFWPQHPSRSPMVDTNIWKESFREYAELIKKI